MLCPHAPLPPDRRAAIAPELPTELPRTSSSGILRPPSPLVRPPLPGCPVRHAVAPFLFFTGYIPPDRSAIVPELPTDPHPDTCFRYTPAAIPARPATVALFTSRTRVSGSCSPLSATPSGTPAPLPSRSSLISRPTRKSPSAAISRLPPLLRSTTPPRILIRNAARTSIRLRFSSRTYNHAPSNHGHRSPSHQPLTLHPPYNPARSPIRDSTLRFTTPHPALRIQAITSSPSTRPTHSRVQPTRCP